MQFDRCFVCGNGPVKTVHNRVLWPALVKEWELTAEEAIYIDKQQGSLCNYCGASLRSIVLAQALISVFGSSPTDCTYESLWDFVSWHSHVDILEVNEAGSLHGMLSLIPGHVFGTYPEVDIQCLPYPTASFDVVTHSDTLEHVIDPMQALKECYRVLRPDGTLCYTVPIVVGRMSRSRQSLPPSYHGYSHIASDDMLVRTEFGADAWTLPMQAGFSKVQIFTLDFPTAIALVAYK